MTPPGHELLLSFSERLNKEGKTLFPIEFKGSVGTGRVKENVSGILKRIMGRKMRVM